jgi:uncharacterized membrane protein HdeD (DUF308 family)
MDITVLVRNWWAVGLRGLAAIAFGVLAFVVPGLTLAALVLLFGGYAVAEGILNVVAAIRRRRGDRLWWAVLLQGLASVAAGLLAFVYPGLTALVLVYVIAGWAIVTGILAIVAAIRLREVIRGEVWLGLSGVLSVAFGVLLAVAPGAGALALVLWIGAYAFAMGVLLVALAFRLRRARDEERPPLARAA